MERSALRVGDAERQGTVDALAAHAAAGRLSLDEFGLRAGGAWAASTAGDLARLVADLPPLPSPAMPGKTAPRAALLAAAVLVAVVSMVLIAGLVLPASAASMLSACM